MKLNAALLILMTGVSSMALAAGSSYNVSLKQNMQGLARNSCLAQIYQISKAQGSGEARVVFSEAGLVVANAGLTEEGAREVQSLPCVEKVELNQLNSIQ